MSEENLSPYCMRVKDVAKFIGMSEPTIWRLVSLGRFPKGIKLTAAITVWRQTELIKWIEERATAAPTDSDLMIKQRAIKAGAAFKDNRSALNVQKR